MTAIKQPLEDKYPQAAEFAKQRANSGFWMTFASTFITILLAEMGDKTQLATLLIAAESHSPWLVFAGAALALIATSLLGVAVGVWLTKRVSSRIQAIFVGLLLICVSVSLLWDVVTY